MGIENKIEKELESIELTSEEGKIIWFKKYKDGTVGEQTSTGIKTSDSIGMKVLIENLEDTFGKGVIDKLP